MNINNVSRQAIQKELHRWFGPSPMSASLQQRINNRGIMQWSHRAIMVGGMNDNFTKQVIEKVERKSRKGELNHHQRQLKVKDEGVVIYMNRPMTAKAIKALNPQVWASK